MQKKAQVQAKLDEWGMDMATKTVEQLEAIKQGYAAENQTLTSYLSQQASTYDIPTKLAEIGTVQQQIKDLQKQNNEKEVDVDTALARDELLRSRDTSANAHTIYLLDRPVRRSLVPYLWALSVIFVGIGVLLFYWLTPLLFPTASTNLYGAVPSTGSITMTLTELFTSPLTWMALFGATAIVILFLGLKIAGVFGK